MVSLVAPLGRFFVSEKASVAVLLEGLLPVNPPGSYCRAAWSRHGVPFRGRYSIWEAIISGYISSVLERRLKQQVVALLAVSGWVIWCERDYGWLPRGQKAPDVLPRHLSHLANGLRGEGRREPVVVAPWHSSL